MTLEELEALVNSQKVTIENLTNQLTTLTQSVQKIVNTPTPSPTPAPEPTPTPSPSPSPTPTPVLAANDQTSVQVDALSQQLKDLQDQLKATEKKALLEKVNATLSSSIANKSLRSPNVVKELLSKRWSDKIIEDNGQLYYKDGNITKAINVMFDDWMKTDEGKDFIPASRPNGTNITTNNSVTNPATSNTPAPKNSLEAFEQEFKASKAPTN